MSASETSWAEDARAAMAQLDWRPRDLVQALDGRASRASVYRALRDGAVGARVRAVIGDVLGIKPPEVELALGPQVRAHRQRAGMTERELAECMQMTARHLRRIESGQSGTARMRPDRFAQVLGCHVNELDPTWRPPMVLVDSRWDADGNWEPVFAPGQAAEHWYRRRAEPNWPDGPENDPSLPTPAAPAAAT